MPTLKRLAILGGIFLCCVRCWAQDDPFGGLGDFVPDAPAAAATASGEEVQEENPLVQQLLERSRRGNLELADAIASLIRLQRLSEADRLLSLLSGRGLDSGTLAEMSQRIGPAALLRMRGYEELSDEARSGLDQLTKAAVSEAESPARIQRAIDDLDADSTDARLRAARVLLRGGNEAIAQLVAAAVAQSPAAPQVEVLRTLMQLGPGGVEALRQLALYGTETVKERATEALVRISREAHAVELVTALHDTDASDGLRELARANLRVMGGVPGREEALEILQLDFDDKRSAASRTDNDQQQTVLWEIDADRSGVSHKRVNMIYAVYRDVVDAGNRMRRVGGLSIERQAQILAAELAYHVMVDPDWGSRQQVAQIRASYGMDDHSLISAAMREAIATSDQAAAIGLIRMINVDDVSVLDRNLLLRGNLASPTPLVQLVSSPWPQVRYEAALATARLAATARYAGSSTVMRTLSEMTSLTERPLAILVETRREVILAQEGILNDLGFQVDVVGGVAGLQRRVRQGGDLRLILSKTELPDLPPVEMVDLVRRLDRGRQLPIVFYGTQPAGLVERRWMAPTVLIDRPVSAVALQGVMEMDRRAQRIPPLGELDRRGLRDAASQWLERRVDDLTLQRVDPTGARGG